jgi:hypothetical protein
MSSIIFHVTIFCRLWSVNVDVFSALSSWSIFGGLTSVFLVNFGSVYSRYHGGVLVDCSSSEDHVYASRKLVENYVVSEVKGLNPRIKIVIAIGELRTLLPFTKAVIDWRRIITGP